MSGSVEVDTNQLRKAAVESDGIHDSLTRTLSTLRGVVSGGGSPWGNDSFGKKFADGDKGYLAARENLLAAIEQMATTFGGYANGQRSAADTMDAMEAGNAHGYN